MFESIIKPTMFNLPKLTDEIILFFNLQDFYHFRSIYGGSKVKSFGPAKRFSLEINHIVKTVLGGMIGAPLSVLILENAIASGVKTVYALGSAGYLGSKPRYIGNTVVPVFGRDETGMTTDYGADLDTEFLFKNVFKASPCQGIVSVNSFYRLSKEKVKKHRQDNIDLVDMEATPMRYIATTFDCKYHPLFVISDQVDEKYQWYNGAKSEQYLAGIENGMRLLTASISPKPSSQ